MNKSVGNSFSFWNNLNKTLISLEQFELTFLSLEHFEVRIYFFGKCELKMSFFGTIWIKIFFATIWLRIFLSARNNLNHIFCQNLSSKYIFSGNRTVKNSGNMNFPIFSLTRWYTDSYDILWFPNRKKKKCQKCSNYEKLYTWSVCVVFNEKVVSAEKQLLDYSSCWWIDGWITFLPTHHRQNLLFTIFTKMKMLISGKIFHPQISPKFEISSVATFVLALYWDLYWHDLLLLTWSHLSGSFPWVPRAINWKLFWLLLLLHLLLPTPLPLLPLEKVTQWSQGWERLSKALLIQGRGGRSLILNFGLLPSSCLHQGESLLPQGDAPPLSPALSLLLPLPNPPRCVQKKQQVVMKVRVTDKWRGLMNREVFFGKRKKTYGGCFYLSAFCTPWVEAKTTVSFLLSRKYKLLILFPPFLMGWIY